MVRPLLSVIVPAHQAEGLLPDTLGALLGNDLPRDRWELIVVDDASRDATRRVAACFADRMVVLDGMPGGPAKARNAGASVARGEWLVFVDADVRTHRDALRRIVEGIERDRTVVALFGTYDARPHAPGLVSRYRNLLHRYVHLSGAGPAESFWAGLGAVRRDTFAEVGGFDMIRYPRPQIEDIELGYRMRDRGARIILDPLIQGTHLKRWTFGTMLRTDFFDRALPWIQLVLRRTHHTSSLNIRWQERVKVLMAGLALAAVGASVLLLDSRLLLAAATLEMFLVLWNVPVYRWFAGQAGVKFAIAVIPLHLAYYAANAVAAAIGVARHVVRRRGTAASDPSGAHG